MENTLLTNTPQPYYTIFPYTTLFRSLQSGDLSSMDDEQKSSAKSVADTLETRLNALYKFQAGLQTLARSEEHTSELQSRRELVCRLLLEKKKHNLHTIITSKKSFPRI